MIYIQIAAYKDPELVPTIIDCILKAKYKSDLRFGICWQKDQDDNSLDLFRDSKQFRIDEMAWNESKGLCWARSRLQGLYNGEEYTLQLDSHHRFADDWDEKLIKFLELTGSAKPIMTAYAGIYEPLSNRKISVAPTQMVPERFTHCGTIIFQSQIIEGWQKLQKPVLARFVSGHFFFTLGLHCTEYKYDPNLYFSGDEISLSIRSFTLGYDLFHPHRTVIWHEYIRQGRPKHWKEHTNKNKHLVGLAWHERDAISKRRLRKMLREEDNDEDISGYDLGAVRSHRDYELYAGIDFRGRRLQAEATRGCTPPCTYVDDGQWEAGFLSNYNVTLNWDAGKIDKCDDYEFIYFGVEDRLGNVLYRYDAPPESPEARFSVTSRHVAIRSAYRPAKFVVWPVSKSCGWLKKEEYKL